MIPPMQFILNYIICYKIYSLVTIIFDFMHATSMYVVDTLIVDPLLQIRPTIILGSW